jgi:metal-responsive CopG/Arc/MetJ family transcriptional regulator
MQRTNIYLEDAQTEALDRLAAEEGISRAELIRRMLDRGLAGRDEDLADDLAAIEESFGALADLEVEARGPDARATHLDEVWRLGA